MKCARELVEMRQKAKEEWERKRDKAFAVLLKSSIEFCETVISPALEKEALELKKDKIETSIKLATGIDSYDNEVLRPLYQEEETYADGSLSYNYDNKIAYSKVFIEKYLEEHCLSVNWIKTSYKCYGLGTRNAVYLTVEVK